MEIAASQFKAQCLKLMEQVQQTKEEVVITEHGKPIARLVPVEADTRDPIIGWMKGSVVITGDIVAPLDEVWEAACD